jgi:hypothetical protein
VNTSKQHAETSHGISIAVDDCKTQGMERENSKREKRSCIDPAKEQSSKQLFQALLHGIERLKELTRQTFSLARL